MSEMLRIIINGRPLEVATGTSVAAAMMIAGVPCRMSIQGTPRSPLCGMGVCFECRAIVNRTRHERTCQLICEPEMRVDTDA